MQLQFQGSYLIKFHPFIDKSSRKIKIMMQVYKDFCWIVLELRCNTAQIDADVGKLDEM
jgi:hypothetical protein